jgi:SAM-dependent methyltransferase
LVSIHPALASRYPETGISGFTHDDVEVAFSAQVRSLVTPELRVLDYGAGRGEWFEDDPSAFRKDLQLLKSRCAEVVGCDVDPAVEQNRAVDRTVVIDPGQSLPFSNAYFDLIVSRYVFEHVEDPVGTARELMRVLKPGGWLCALTPNKWGYPALGARMIPNRHHAAAIGKVQPGGRAANDVFATHYRLNTASALRRHFGGVADVHVQYASGPPAYYFGNGFLFRLFSAVHSMQPRGLSTALMIFIRKR